MKYTLTCTALAVSKFKEKLSKRNDPSTIGIRIGLLAGGCSGFSLLMEFANKNNEKDCIFTFDNVSIYVDPKSIIYLDGTEIDYEDGIFKHGFKFKIPKQTETCSCKKSIAF